MRSEDTLQLFPASYFVGLSIKSDRFSSKAQNTERLSKEIRYFCGDEIAVLYSINSRNSNLIWDLNEIVEIQFFQISVPVRNLKSSELWNIAEAIQRGIPYQLVIILSNNQWYKVVTTKWHKGKKKDISVVDEVYTTRWIGADDLRSFFSEFRSNLISKTKITFSDLWQQILSQMDCDAYDLNDPLAFDDDHPPLYFDDDGEVIEFLLDTLGTDDVEQILYDERIEYGNTLLQCYHLENGDIADMQTIQNDDIDNAFIVNTMDKLKQNLDENSFYLIKDGLFDWLSRKRKEDLIALVENYFESLQFN
ncbi:MAG: DUF4391 domain-containing protein [Clostridiales bacterium]|nr:DUF4391 domain-containing protein [Clostridiales bacterium]